MSCTEPGVGDERLAFTASRRLTPVEASDAFFIDDQNQLRIGTGFDRVRAYLHLPSAICRISIAVYSIPVTVPIFGEIGQLD